MNNFEIVKHWNIFAQKSKFCHQFNEKLAKIHLWTKICFLPQCAFLWKVILSWAMVSTECNFSIPKAPIDEAERILCVIWNPHFQIANHPSFDFSDTAVDLCKQPNVVNGDVTAVTDSSNIFVGSVTCNEGYILVGKTRIKCVNGIWSSSTPVCTRKKILFWLLISLGTFR